MSGFSFVTMNQRVRLLLFILIALASLRLGLMTFEPRVAINLFRDYGYYTIAGSVLILFWMLWRAYGRSRHELWAYLTGKAGRYGLLIAILGSIFLLRAEAPGFKTLMDEHIVASTAKMMHEHRRVEVSTRAISIQNYQADLRGFVDKRPILFAFLVSTAHDLTGFRPKNSVYINLLLTPLIVFLVFVIGERLGGIKVGIAAGALISTLPLLSYACASGGLEPINIVCLLVTWLLGGLYLANPGDDDRLGAFGVSAVLLAQARYESIIFVLPVGLLILWSWWQQGRVQLPFALMLCPVLLVPYLLHYQVFNASENAWQLVDVEGAQTAFGLQFIPDNFGRAVGYLFDLGSRTANSWLLTGIGTVSLLFMALPALTRWKTFSSTSAWYQASIFMFFGYVCLFILLLLAYAWPFDTAITVRLSLPLHLPLAIAAAYFCFVLIKATKFQMVCIVLFAFYVVVYALPTTSKKAYLAANVAKTEFEAAELFLREHPAKDMLIVADNSAFFSLHEVDSLNLLLANVRREQIKFYIEQPLSKPVYYFQRLVYEPTKDGFKDSSKGKLHEDFVTEVYWERTINELRKVQFIRIVDVQGVELEEQEYESRQDYLNDWAKNLP